MGSESSPHAPRWLPAPRLLRPALWIVARADNLEEHLVLADHPQFEARPLLDCFQALLQVAHLRFKRVVARLQRLVLRLLARELPVDVPDSDPAAFAEPKRVLNEKDQRG